MNTPVSYADVWEFWLRYREVRDDVDFVTVHMQPYWEDLPVRAEDAAAHVNDIRKQLTWPFPIRKSDRRDRVAEQGADARRSAPIRINQARFVSGDSRSRGRKTFASACSRPYDEPWKRQWEGTVGANWGLLMEDSRVEISVGVPSATIRSGSCSWGAGLALSISVFGVAFDAEALQSAPRLASWVAVRYPPPSAAFCWV